MSDTDLIKLYSGQILALAAEMSHLDRLEAPDASIKKRAPLCGSAVTVDLAMEDGKVSAYGQEVKACALGQAAASVVGANIVGRTPGEIRTARDQLKAMLKQNGPVPDTPFGGFEVLSPARDYKNRHASIMLTLDAAVAALDEIESASSCA